MGGLDPLDMLSRLTDDEMPMSTHRTQTMKPADLEAAMNPDETPDRQGALQRRKTAFTTSPGNNMASPELETLDQLLGGDLSLPVLRRLFPDDERFLRGVHGLLRSGDVALLTADGQPVPPWKVDELFERRAILQVPEDFKLHLTDQGAERVS